MKKLVILTFFIYSLASLGAYKDGEYYVESKNPIHGWKPFTKIIITDGKIDKVFHDRINDKGELASNDASYNENMLKKSGSSPKEFSVNIPINFKNSNYDLEQMDGVAGATTSVKQFKIMADFLLKKAEKGKAGKYKIKNSSL